MADNTSQRCVAGENAATPLSINSDMESSEDEGTISSWGKEAVPSKRKEPATTTTDDSNRTPKFVRISEKENKVSCVSNFATVCSRSLFTRPWKSVLQARPRRVLLPAVTRLPATTLHRVDPTQQVKANAVCQRQLRRPKLPHQRHEEHQLGRLLRRQDRCQLLHCTRHRRPQGPREFQQSSPTSPSRRQRFSLEPTRCCKGR